MEWNRAACGRTAAALVTSHARRAARRAASGGRARACWRRSSIGCIAVKPLEDAIERTIDDDGTVRDDASPRCAAFGASCAPPQGELIRLLERVMERLEPHHRVSDMSVTVRDGRYVIPVRREGRGSVGGIVHDASATGATLFVEPPAAVEFGNRIRELEAEEHEEVERILRELTDALRPHREATASTRRRARDARLAVRARALRARVPLHGHDARRRERRLRRARRTSSAAARAGNCASCRSISR